jgi:hypothetical protein
VISQAAGQEPFSLYFLHRVHSCDHDLSVLTQTYEAPAGIGAFLFCCRIILWRNFINKHRSRSTAFGTILVRIALTRVVSLPSFTTALRASGFKYGHDAILSPN